MNLRTRNLIIVLVALIIGFVGGVALTRYLSSRAFEAIVWRDESVALYRNLRLLDHLKKAEYSEIQQTLERTLNAEVLLLSAVRREGKLDPDCIKALEAGIDYKKQIGATQ